MNICKESLLLEGDNICLRPLLIGDITVDYINGLNDPGVNKYLVSVRQNVQTFKSVEKYVRSCLDEPFAILFGVFLKSDSKSFIGTVHVSDIDSFHFTASIGICLFIKQYWRKGYGLQALEMVKDYLFGQLGLHYIEAGVYTDNIQSVKLFKRVGFSEMYRVNNKYRYIDNFKEVIIFGIINPSFNMSNLQQSKHDLSESGRNEIIS